MIEAKLTPTEWLQERRAEKEAHLCPVSWHPVQSSPLTLTCSEKRRTKKRLPQQVMEVHPDWERCLWSQPSTFAPQYLPAIQKRGRVWSARLWEKNSES